MMKQELTVEELKSLIQARGKLEEGRQAKLRTRIQQELGGEVEEEKPETVLIRDMISELISGTVARRLKEDQRSIPLLSSADFTEITPQVIAMILKSEREEGEELDAKRQTWEASLKMLFERVVETMNSLLPAQKDPYEEYWRWVTIVLHLAAERGIPATELLTFEKTTDEITRRLFSREQFIALSQQATSKFLDVDVLKMLLVEPLILMMLGGTGLGGKIGELLRQVIEEEITPQLNEIIEKGKVVVNTWIDEEVERIFSITA